MILSFASCRNMSFLDILREADTLPVGEFQFQSVSLPKKECARDLFAEYLSQATSFFATLGKRPKFVEDRDGKVVAVFSLCHYEAQP